MNRTQSIKVHIILIIGLFIGSPIVFGDGKFYYQNNLAADFKAYQRAVLSYHNSWENLVIQPAYSGPPKEFGWIIPVPSFPQLVNLKANKLTSFLYRIERECRPEIYHASFIILWGVSIVFLIVFLYDILCILSHYCKFLFSTRPSIFPSSSLARLLSLAFVFGCCVFPAIFARSMSFGGSASSIDQVHVYLDQTFEDYRVRIISSSADSALTDWLNENSFSYSPKDVDTFSHYNKNGFYYLAIKLSPNSEVSNRSSLTSLLPPISFSFPASEPFYPFRLTSTGSGPVEVDLFAISNFPLLSSSTELVSSKESGNVYFNHDLALFYGLPENISLAGLGSQAMFLTKHHGVYPEEKMTPDFTFFPDLDKKQKTAWRLEF